MRPSLVDDAVQLVRLHVDGLPAAAGWEPLRVALERHPGSGTSVSLLPADTAGLGVEEIIGAAMQAGQVALHQTDVTKEVLSAVADDLAALAASALRLLRDVTDGDLSPEVVLAALADALRLERGEASSL